MTRIKKLYIFFIIVSLIICLYGVYKRFDIEKVYDRYQVVMGLDDVKRLAAMQDKNYIEVAKDFHDAGVHTIVVDELSMKSLEHSPDFKFSFKYFGADLIVEGEAKALDFIENGIRRTINDDRKIERRGEEVLFVEGNELDFRGDTQIDGMGLGFDEDLLREMTKKGISINLRPIYASKYQDGAKAIDYYFDIVSKYSPGARTVLFGGDILGGDSNLGYLQQKCTEFGIMPIFIENTAQDGNTKMAGLESLIDRMDYKAVRLFSTLTFIQQKYDYGIAGHHEGQEIINTYYRAITERNVRVIYFRPFMNPQGKYITDMGIYRQRFAELEDRLGEYYGIAPISADGDLVAMNRFELSKKIKIFAIFGTIVAWLLIAEEFFRGDRRIRIALWVLAAIVMLASVALYREKLEQLFALLATIAFAVLSVTYLMQRIKKYSAVPGNQSIYRNFLTAIFELLACVFISLGGAVFVVVLYAHSKYMLEFSKFVGVKASQMAPLVIIMLVYVSIQSVDFKAAFARIGEVLQANIKVWQVILVGVFAAILVVMLLRSGHTSNVEVPSFELWFRNMLELITPARPRTKAIFLGFPALLVLVMLAKNARFKKTYVLFLVAATIGQANIINSFSHIRTPLIVSLYRVLGEYIISVLIVLLFVVLFDICRKIYRRIRMNA